LIGDSEMRYDRHMNFTRTLFALVISASFAACGGTGAHVGGSDGTGGTGGGGGGGTTTSGTGGNAGPLLPADAHVGTYIALGDSISDGGGTGPYFYDLLDADLEAKFPGVTFVHAAQQDAITDVYSDNMPAGAPLLKSQIAGLGSSYTGDVVVTITIGGNDLNAHAIKAIGGMDATVRAEFGTHLDAELAELATPGRLGSGKVYIVVANIYDFTDGQGDFATVKCALGANVSAASDQSVFSGWNAVAATSIANAGGTLYDMHASFDGHGYNNPDTTQVWYDRNSCIHPNALGHDAIRRSIYTIVTGDALP
jgi:lysophospholipase L1-like esterase